MAGTDQLDVTFYGIGGHGSTPQFTKDPVIMATTAVNNYQSIISRTIEPKEEAVLIVGSIRAGDNNNVIPSTALLKLNLRWFNERERKTMIEGIERINEGIALANGLSKDKYPTIKRKGWSYPLKNTESLTRVVKQGIKSHLKGLYILTEEHLPSVMGSEPPRHTQRQENLLLYQCRHCRARTIRQVFQRRSSTAFQQP